MVTVTEIVPRFKCIKIRSIPMNSSRARLTNSEKMIMLISREYFFFKTKSTKGQKYIHQLATGILIMTSDATCIQVCNKIILVSFQKHFLFIYKVKLDTNTKIVLFTFENIMFLIISKY